MSNLFILSSILSSSVYRKAYIEVEQSSTMMQRLCYSFLDSLTIIYGKHRKTPLCHTTYSVC